MSDKHPYYLLMNQNIENIKSFSIIKIIVTMKMQCFQKPHIARVIFVLFLRCYQLTAITISIHNN